MMTTDAALLSDLQNAARRAEMTGNAARATNLEGHAAKVESLDPIYQQTKDAAKVRKAARAALARANA